MFNDFKKLWWEAQTQAFDLRSQGFVCTSVRV